MLSNKELEDKLRRVLNILDYQVFRRWYGDYINEDRQYESLCYKIGALENPLKELISIIKEILGED